MSSSAAAIAALTLPGLVAAALHPAQKWQQYYTIQFHEIEQSFFFLFPNTFSGDRSSHSVMMHSDEWIGCQTRLQASSTTIALWRVAFASLT